MTSSNVNLLLKRAKSLSAVSTSEFPDSPLSAPTRL